MTHPNASGTSCPFRIVRSPDYEASSQAAARHLVSQLKHKPDSLFVLATGSSPERAYQLLAEQGHQQPPLCEQLRILKLDEWGGLELDDPATCETALRRLLVEPLRMGPERFVGWQSRTEDVAAECRRMERWLAKNGPPDICVLGLGFNGHLGFNEPAPWMSPGPHRADLSRESLEHSMLKLARAKPAYGLTLGLRDILSAREILLLISGAQKLSQLRRLLTPEITPQFPASFLWLHPSVTVYCDAAALPDGSSNT